jgi:excisionase family DNA binding protein
MSAILRQFHGSQDDHRLWTIAQAALHLACSERQVRRLIARQALPAYRIAGARQVRIRPGDVERLLTPLGGLVTGGLDDFISEVTS